MTLSVPVELPGVSPAEPKKKNITRLVVGDLAPGYYLTVVCVLIFYALMTIRRTGAVAITQ